MKRQTKLITAFAAATAAFALSANGALVAYFPVDSATDSTNFLDDIIDDASHGVSDGVATSNAGSIIFDATRGGDVLSTVQGHRYVAGTQDIDLNVSGFTWSLWVKSDSVANLDEGADVIIGSRNGGWNKVQADGTSSMFTMSYDIDDDTWHHIAYTGSSTVDGGAAFWIDGVKAAFDLTHSRLADNTKMEIGGSDRYSEMWDGLMDDIAIYDTVLTDAQIISLAGGASPTTIPEPTTTALLGLGGLALILRRRK